jgi:hypothetical protein
MNRLNSSFIKKTGISFGLSGRIEDLAPLPKGMYVVKKRARWTAKCAKGIFNCLWGSVLESYLL